MEEGYCKRGHLLTDENRYFIKEKRNGHIQPTSRCKECKKMHSKNRRDRLLREDPVKLKNKEWETYQKSLVKYGREYFRERNRARAKRIRDAKCSPRHGILGVKQLRDHDDE